MRRRILQVFVFMFAASSIVGLTQAPKDGKHIGSVTKTSRPC